jgi:hypothetical protein
MSYLIYVAMFGAAAVLFLWLRDARIFFRTGLPGYRKAAYYGVGYGALATLGGAVTLTMPCTCREDLSGRRSGETKIRSPGSLAVSQGQRRIRNNEYQPNKDKDFYHAPETERNAGFFTG